MNERKLGEIPALKEMRGLPVTFKLLSQKIVDEQPRKNLFFYVEVYQGMALAEAYQKPYSKTIDWKKFNG